MKADIERWQNKYSRDGYSPVFRAEQDLVEQAEWFSGNGRALDLACGVGHNAIWLAEQGYATTAIDGSQKALDFCKQESNRRGLGVTTIAADLDDYPLAENAYDAIVVVRYLNRDLFRPIKNATRPRGIVFYKTFNQNLLNTKPDFNPDYVLQDNELKRVFADWEWLAESTTDNSTQSWVLTKKPG